MLKLLLVIKDFSNWLHVERYRLQLALAGLTDLEVWHEPGNIHDIVKKIRFKPDFILLYLYGSINAPRATGLDTLKIPYGVYVQDLHSLKNLHDQIVKNNIRYIFNCYRDMFLNVYPQFADRMIWIPHHVDLSVYRDYGLKKEIPMLMMGAVNPVTYPLRHKMLRALAGRKDFVFHAHPGYRNIGAHEGKFVREKYAMEINRAKLFLTCDSIYQYPVAKYFEVPACRTLLLAPDSPELYDLGFRAGEHFVAINEKDFLEKAKYYASHDEERQAIADNGFRLVRTRHSTAARAKELVASIRNIVGKP